MGDRNGPEHAAKRNNRAVQLETKKTTVISLSVFLYNIIIVMKSVLLFVYCTLL